MIIIKKKKKITYSFFFSLFFSFLFFSSFFEWRALTARVQHVLNNTKRKSRDLWVKNKTVFNCAGYIGTCVCVYLRTIAHICYSIIVLCDQCAYIHAHTYTRMLTGLAANQKKNYSKRTARSPVLDIRKVFTRVRDVFGGVASLKFVLHSQVTY